MLMNKNLKFGPLLPAPVDKPKKRPASAGQANANATVKKKSTRPVSSISGNNHNNNNNVSQFMSNASQLSSSSQPQQSNWRRGTMQSSFSKFSKLNNSFEEKKQRLSRLKSLLKEEKNTLDEELGGSSEDEDFEYLQKESAMKEFQKHVKKQEERSGGEGGGGATKTFQSSMTLKKEQGSLLGLNGQEDRDLQTTLTSNVAKNPPPNRGESGITILQDNFFATPDQSEAGGVIEFDPTHNQTAAPVVNEVKKDPNRRRIHTLKERIKCCVTIQSVVRMFVMKCRFKKEQKRVQLLLQEHQMSKVVNQYEEEVEAELYEMGRGGFSVNVKPRYRINFPGVNIAGSESLQNNVFYPTLLKNLAEFGHLELMNDPQKVAQQNHGTQDRQRANQQSKNGKLDDEDFDLVDPDKRAERTFKMFKAQMNPMRKKKSDFLPMNVPLQKNNYFTDTGIIDCFVRRNLNNIPVSLKKSVGGSTETFTKARLPEQFSTRASSSETKGKQTSKVVHTEEDSAYYLETFEKESVSEMTPVSKRIDMKGQKKITNDSAVSEESYLHESFDIDESSSSMIKESIQFNSSRRSGGQTAAAAGGGNEESINESIQDFSIQDESTDPKIPTNSKRANLNSSVQEDIIQTSVEEQYDSEFENISEDLNNESMHKRNGLNQSISEDIIGTSFESSRVSKKKKSVSFGGGSKPQTAQQQQQTTHPAHQTLQSSGSGILRKSSDQVQIQSHQQQQFSSSYQKVKDAPQLPSSTHSQVVSGSSGIAATISAAAALSPTKKSEIFLSAEPVSELWKKYENLRVQHESETQLREMTKEQLEMGRIQREIYQMLDSTKKLTEKWRLERESLVNSERDVSQQADYLYSKFQCEFNRLLGSTAVGGKFALLSNYFDYKDKKTQQVRVPASSKDQSATFSTTESFRTTPSSQIEQMMQKIEAKQEIMSGVLMQIVENLTSMRRTNLDFNEMRENRKENDSKLDRLLANQEKLLKAQYENQLKSKDSDIKLLLQALQGGNITLNPTQLDEESMRKLRLKSLLSQNIRGPAIIPLSTEALSHQQPKLGSQKLLNESIMSDSIDSSVDHEAGAMRDSGVSWQSERSTWENLTEKDKEKINEFNTEEVVDFLSKMLLEELQSDLFPVRMATSHFNAHKKPSDQFLIEKMNVKMVPNSTNNKQDPRRLSGSASLGQESPYQRRTSQKSDRTLTEESKYDDDFEDSEEKFHQSLQSNNLNNKSYQFEDSESSMTGSAANNLSGRFGQQKSSFDVKGAKQRVVEEDNEQEDDDDENHKRNQSGGAADQDSEIDYAEDIADEGDKSVSEDEKPVQVSSKKTAPLKVTKPIDSNDGFDPMGGLGGNRAFDRNSLLAEIEENDKKGGPTKAKSPRSSALPPVDEDLKGDNDFFATKEEFENGQERKDNNKELIRNEDYYQSTSRALEGLVATAKKQKKKLALIKLFTKLLMANNSANKRLDSFLGQLPAAGGGSFIVFEPSEVKEDNKATAQAFSERLFANLVKNTHDLEQFHHGQAFNKKLIEQELASRWDHLCDVSSQQTLEVIDKVVPVEYYSDVKISKHTPDTKVRRFCKINAVPKDDIDLFEVQEYELYKEQIHVQNKVANNILQQLAESLAKDILKIQNKQAKSR